MNCSGIGCSRNGALDASVSKEVFDHEHFLCDTEMVLQDEYLTFKDSHGGYSEMSLLNERELLQKFINCEEVHILPAFSSLNVHVVPEMKPLVIATVLQAVGSADDWTVAAQILTDGLR